MKFKRGKVFFGDSIRKEEVDGITLFYSPNFLAAVDREGRFQALLFEYEGNGCSKLSCKFSGTLSLQDLRGLEVLAPFGFYLLREGNFPPQPVAGMAFQYRGDTFISGIQGSKFFYLGGALISLENLPVKVNDENLKALADFGLTIIRPNCKIFQGLLKSFFINLLKKFKRGSLEARTFVGNRVVPDSLAKAVPVGFSRCGKIVQVVDSFFDKGPLYAVVEKGIREVNEDCFKSLEFPILALKKPLVAQAALKKIMQLRLLSL